VRRRYVTGERNRFLDHGVDEDEGFEEAWVEERKIGKLGSTHAVANSDDGTRHLRPEGVDHVEEVATVVEPGGCGSLVLVTR
jgi:hypothetical protein